tara:strand:- start:307 stop:528 length:222 start_codon:yes stop_codon:yes gene_type:complete
MKTAINALKELLQVNDIYKESMPHIIEIIDEVYLPMEKQQILDAFSEGASDGFYGESDSNREQYYNETYKQDI